MKRNTVSLCIIARDEEATIGMAIKSVLALVDELIVVDTGSQDNTRIIAEGYGAKVFDVPWSDDFSAARNAALDQATGKWILVLDADEFLEPVRPVEFQRLLHDPAAAGFRLRVINQGGQNSGAMTSRVRLFRNLPEVRYRYPIHERLAPALDEWAARENLLVMDSDLAVVHERYDTDRRALRRDRNQRILRKALDGYPSEPYFPYRLACEGLSLLDGEVLPVAGLSSGLVFLRNSWSLVRALPAAEQAALTWLPELGALLISGLLTSGHLAEAAEAESAFRKATQNHPLILLQSVAVDVARLQEPGAVTGRSDRKKVIAGARKNLDRVAKSRRRSPGTPVDSRVRELYPLRYRGELALLEGAVTEAVGLYEKALSLDPAYSCGWLGLAECSRFAGDDKRALRLYLRTVTENENNHRAWLLGRDLMLRMDFKDNATSWWRMVTERFPEHPAVLAEGRAAPCAGLTEAEPAVPVTT